MSERRHRTTHCPHEAFEAQVTARHQTAVPDGQRYQVLVRVRCAECRVPLTFELPQGFMGDYVAAATQTPDGQEARLGATLKTPVPASDEAPWQAVAYTPPAPVEPAAATAG